MGKIFDALEKAKQEEPIPAPPEKYPELVRTLFDKSGSDKPGSDKSGILIKDSEFENNNRVIDEDIIAYADFDSIEAEQFKMLRTNILFPVSGQPPRSILVTSAMPGEGKTFVAANLAVSIARNINEHVLLIDCDLRKPSIHTRFGYNNVRGLSEYLSRNVPLASLLLKTKIKKLTLLPGGKIPDNPSELLSSEAMKKMLVEVTERYKDRIIIIDSPPPQLTAETNVIARQVDGILLVIKYGGTKREMVAEMIGRLGKEKVLGVVFNWLSKRATSYYGYGKYGK
ncbi:hypothetical protein BuS5_00002 [Desulfosarcina sp. BuS5]|uniref:CpsD/CapB family tyrosine-protein kinase n=1 Tax=Desulfosarcina sp. BuS5 TaxID=933262 RepID=UPI00047F2FFB|nr:CpsD/CapB family tyrosine-protein kinase [Desulfosarcina sp. BuS5]WDN87034.1 hypothetical protein BuS5_00002 [Desulfosarcina sp. BuS5]